MEKKEYVLVDKFAGTGGAPNVIGPFTFKEADDLLRKGAAMCGDYSPDAGYWSKLPCWDVRDDYCWLMRKLDNVFHYLDEAREEMEMD